MVFRKNMDKAKYTYVELPRNYKIILFICKFVHIFDLFLGIAFFLNGALLLSNGIMPETGGVILSIGLVFLFTSTNGIMGFFSTSRKRIGLSLSSNTAILTSFVDLLIGLSLLIQRDNFLSYLDYKASSLYGTTIVEILKANPLEIGICFVVLGIIELVRFFMLGSIRIELLKIDAIEEAVVEEEGGEEMYAEEEIYDEEVYEEEAYDKENNIESDDIDLEAKYDEKMKPPSATPPQATATPPQATAPQYSEMRKPIPEQKW